MISCIEWVPKGVADPNPKRYELSKLERDLLEQDARELADVDGNEDEECDDEGMMKNDTRSKNKKDMTASEIVASQTVDSSALPEELKMDEYSDDDDTNPMSNESAIGDLLIGNDKPSHVEPEDSGESDDDDDLRDVPDTREYMPTDIKGMEAMQFDGHSGMPGDDEDEDDDASDLEDTNLQPDDAMIVVAKTEEVSNPYLYVRCEIFQYLTLFSIHFVWNRRDFHLSKLTFMRRKRVIYLSTMTFLCQPIRYVCHMVRLIVMAKLEIILLLEHFILVSKYGA